MMFNPFVPFHSKMIETLRKMGRRWLVSQTYQGGMDHFQEESKEPIILSDYDSLEQARVHYHALTDKYRAILDLEKEEHRNKLIEMIGPDSKYKVLAAFVEDMKQVEKMLNAKYNQNIRNYIRRETNWRIGGDHTIFPKLELTFGELFVSIKYSNQHLRIRLADLEKY